MKVLGFLLRLGFWLFAITTPLAGFWLASSLAAFSGTSLQVAALAGLALFPFLPLFWVGLAELRRKRRGATAPHTLSFGDRLLWRTLLLNVAFVGGLLYVRPEASFLALSTRGDWMVEGLDSPMATLVRDASDTATSRIEWLYERSRDNPYAKPVHDEPPPPPLPTPTRGSGPPIRRWPIVAPTPERGVVAAAVPTPEPLPTPDLDTPGEAPRWPMPATLDPILARMPPSVDTSPEAAGRWLGDTLRDDPFRLAKALHDYIADRVEYDLAALAAFPDVPRDAVEAEGTWRTRRGVCAGYADLFRVMAKAAGLEAAYVVGETRSESGGVRPIKHAWNAVKIRDGWYLLDVTWNAGSADSATGGKVFRKRYSTEYLFAPPEVFGLDHFPEEERWQLRADPLERAEFVRQPLLRPDFLAKGLELLSPVRPQVDTAGSLDVRIRNPRQLSLIVTATRKGTAEETKCLVVSGVSSVATCTFGEPGAWSVAIFANEQRYGSHPYVAGIDVNDRG